jgi:hypothetical protein
VDRNRAARGIVVPRRSVSGSGILDWNRSLDKPRYAPWRGAMLDAVSQPSFLLATQLSG